MTSVASSPLEVIEWILYVLAIVLAVYSIWEFIPKGARWGKGLAFSGALATLYLMFFLTSIHVGELRDTTNGLKTKVETLTKCKELASLDEAGTKQSRVLAALAHESIDRFVSLGRDGLAELTADEGREFLARFIQQVLDPSMKGVEIIAVSIDLTEFDAQTSTLNSYTAALAAARSRGITVRRAYLLPHERFEQAREELARVTSAPEFSRDSIERCLNNGLQRIADHYRQNLECVLVDATTFSDAERGDLDTLVIKQGEKTILAAQRVRTGQIRIMLTHDFEVARSDCERVFGVVNRYVIPSARVLEGHGSLQ